MGNQIAQYKAGKKLQQTPLPKRAMKRFASRHTAMRPHEASRSHSPDKAGNFDRMPTECALLDSQPVALSAAPAFGAVTSEIFGSNSCHSFSALLLDSVSDAVFFCDAENVCRLANSRLAIFLRKSLEQIVHKPIAEIFPPAMARAILRQHRQVTHSAAEITSACCELPCPDGSGTLWIARGHAYYDTPEHCSGAVWILQDVTEFRRLEQEIVQICDTERERLAIDIHDEICQDLAAVSLISRLLENKLTSNTSPYSKIAGHIAAITKDLAVNARNLVHNLAPADLTGPNFIAALRKIAELVSTAYCISCTIDGSCTERLEDPTIALHLYRMTHEAIYNAAKHSNGTCISVTLSSSESNFHIEVCDDGTGIDSSKSDPGIGISTMQYRAHLIGAQCKVTSNPQGTTVTFTLPLS